MKPWRRCPQQNRCWAQWWDRRKKKKPSVWKWEQHVSLSVDSQKPHGSSCLPANEWFIIQQHNLDSATNPKQRAPLSQGHTSITSKQPLCIKLGPTHKQTITKHTRRQTEPSGEVLHTCMHTHLGKSEVNSTFCLFLYLWWQKGHRCREREKYTQQRKKKKKNKSVQINKRSSTKVSAGFSRL